MQELNEARRWLTGEMLGDGYFDGQGEGRDPEQRVEDAAEAIHCVLRARFLASPPEVPQEAKLRIETEAKALIEEAHAMLRAALGEMAAEKVFW